VEYPHNYQQLVYYFQHIHTKADMHSEHVC